MQLLISQLNELYDLIISSKHFSPTQFTKSTSGDQFQFTGTGYYFRIYEDNMYANSLIVNYSPGETFYQDGSSSMPWKDLKEHFIKWLKYLRREISSPDKWGRVFDEVQYLVGTTANQNVNFTHQEYLTISAQIDHIKSALNQIPLLQEQNSAIKHQLDHLLELTTELNKFDWQNLLIGTIFSIIIQLEVTQENAALLYELIKHAFRGLFLK